MSKKGILLSVALFIGALCARAQDQSINSPLLTTVLPPAPNAYEITKYSALPVNLSTGSVSANIPLGQVSSGKVRVPISLAYNSGSGVKVNQIASRSGMSWVLNAGGVITRSMYDKPDESYPYVHPPADSTSSSYPYEYYDYYKSVAGELGDSQSDIFNFDFNGYSGRFILNPANKTQIVMVSASTLKIETNFHGEFSGDWTFRVTDPTGTKYLFGGTGATEQSKTVPEGSCGKTFASYVPNAWYLKSIQHYTGEYIWLTYAPCTFDYLADESESMVRTPLHPGLGNNTCAFTDPIRTEYQLCPSDLRSNGVILKSINSRFQSVKFNYSTRLDVVGDSLLTGVDFYSRDLIDTTQVTLKSSFGMNYVYSNNAFYYNPNGTSTPLTHRPFLVQVQRTGTGLQAETHKMAYYDINGLPSRLSFAQDYWGYANGANNTHLIPQSTDPDEVLKFPVDMANREPNASFVYSGLLSKITYPTAGTDSIIYEPHTVYDTRSVYPQPTTVDRTVTGTGIHDEVADTYNFTVGPSQVASIHAWCTYSGTGVNDFIHQHMFVEVFSSGDLYNPLWSDILNIDSTYYKSMPLSSGGSYVLRIRADGQAAVAHATMTWTAQGNSVTGNFETGGLRVSKTVTTPLTGSVTTKKYVYAALETQGISSGLLRARPHPQDYYSYVYTSRQCDAGTFVWYFYNGSSSSLVPYEYAAGSHIYYYKVIELKGEHWENGGIEHRYLIDAETAPLVVRNGTQPPLFGGASLAIQGTLIPGVPISNSGFTRGLEDMSRTFFTTGGTPGAYTFKVVSSTGTHYKTDNTYYKVFANYVVRQNWMPYAIPDPPDNRVFASYDEARYNIVCQWIYADTTVTTNYDLAGNNPVVTSQYDTYADQTHQQLTQRKTISSDGSVKTVLYKYPHDMVLGGTTVPYQAMIDNNLITHPIEQLYYKDGLLKQGLKTNYGSFGNNIYEPDSIETKTGTGNYESRIRLYSYNTNGGLLAQSKTHGSKTSYLWGYGNLLPVAEIKTANENEIFYEGFEYTSGASTAYSHTGSRSNHGALTINFSPPAGKNYVISWFQKNGSIWDYHKEAYTGSKAFSASDYIDDICVYPERAQMSVYAYDPYIGQTAGIDARGSTTSYEYDNYQRLTNVRDLTGNILKSYQYHFNSSPPATVYYNNAQTQSYRKNCPGGFGSLVSYTVYAGTYSSITSQADADAQAIAEMNIAGQANANNNGQCFTGTRHFSYENDCNIAGGSSTPSGGITSLKFKDASGNVLYTFTESQLMVGIDVPVGLYNLELQTYGSTYNLTTHLGWSILSINNFIVNNTNAAGNIYTISNADLTTAGSWAITVGSAL
ncbi:YD repeat-containing protein [Mucilaginibacter gracilis]|uniref:YD repeat-containing protein n=1 Tax=Mucilaginibacter gracilis TaxID=423350 RepID=A0A495J5C6_9SPHI|nr:DUF5977 domain-containing protein [Mucilaginibacter gracilis]RKR84180.1 YD repeat-containing protein [Mucilaginibacter gracilis]